MTQPLAEQIASLTTQAEVDAALRAVPEQFSSRLQAEATRRRASMSGRAKTPTPCPYCGLVMGAREWREHRADCRRAHSLPVYARKKRDRANP